MSVNVSPDSGSENLSVSPYQETIDEVGGKAASLLVQQEGGNEDMIFPYSIIKSQDFETGNVPDFSFTRKQIIRGSASGDERGLVDAIRTIPNVELKDLRVGIQKRLDATKMSGRHPNALVKHMLDKGIGVSKIADALGIDYSEDAMKEFLNSQQAYAWENSQGEVSDALIKQRIEYYIKEEQEDMPPYTDPFFFGQGDLGVEFDSDDIQMLEFGDRDGNPIHNVLQQSRRKGVIDYAKRWDGLENYTGASSVIVQFQNHTPVRGSVVEHPNIEGHYLVNLVLVDDSGRDKFIEQFLVNAKGKLVTKSKYQSVLDRDASLQEIIKMKIRSREAGFIDEQFSSQVEFGVLPEHMSDCSGQGYDFAQNPTNPIVFYQERKFLPFDFHTSVKPSKYEFNKFGVPEKGLEARVVNLNDTDLDPSLFTDGVDTVYILTHQMLFGNSYPNFFPNNMKGVIVGFEMPTVGGNSLEHNTYRYILKGGMAIMKDSNYYSEHLKTGENKLFI